MSPEEEAMTRRDFVRAREQAIGSSTLLLHKFRALLLRVTLTKGEARDHIGSGLDLKQSMVELAAERMLQRSAARERDVVLMACRDSYRAVRRAVGQLEATLYPLERPLPGPKQSVA